MKRVFWAALGFGAGIAGAVMTGKFLSRQRRRASEAPKALVREARGGIMDAARLFSESMAEGKAEMARREAELRGQMRGDGWEDAQRR